MEQSAGKPAPYGRACVNCARAKCKCILRDEGGICERCFRLKKQCTPSTTVRKKRQRTSNSQTARLEQKLDGLVSLLKSDNRNNFYYENAPSSASSAWDAANENSQTVTPTAPAAANTPIVNNNNKPTTSTITHALTPLTPASSSSSSFPYFLPRDADVSAEEAAHYLHIFRTQHLRFFPFYWLPEEKTSQELRQEYPFLWLCIMSVSTTVISQQIALTRVVREITCKEIIMEGERTLDLLLGLLCILGWGQWQVHLGPLLTVFSHLCIALTTDLELHKSPQKDIGCTPKCPPPRIHFKFKIPDTRTLEHRRIALSCYLVTSSFASLNQTVDGLPWSPYLDECVKVLEEAKEAPHDELLLCCVKIQHVTSKTTEILTHIRDIGKEESTQFIGPYISSLRQQLNLVKDQIPSHLASNVLLQLSIHYSEMSINELILLRLQFKPIAADSGHEALDSLFACLQAIKSYFDGFLKYEPTEYLGMTFFLWKQMAAAVFLLARLASLEDPGWDVNYVKRAIDLPSTLGQSAENIECLIDLAGWRSSIQENVYMRSSRMIGVLKNWAMSIYQSAVPTAGAAAPPPVSFQHPNGLPAVDGELEKQQQQQQQHHHHHQNQNQHQHQHHHDHQTAAAAEAMATAQPMQIPGAPILPTFDQEFWSDDVFGLWDIYSARPFTYAV